MGKRNKARVVEFYGKIGAELMELDRKIEDLYMRRKISRKVYLKIKDVIRRHEEKVERFLAEVEELIG